MISYAIAVGITKVKDVRSNDYKNSAIEANDGSRPSQAFDEDSGLVESTVIIGVLEQPNAPQLVVTMFRIANHFHHVKPSVGIKGHGDRIDDLGFSRRQLDVETFLETECLNRIPSLNRSHSGQLLRGSLGFGGMNKTE